MDEELHETQHEIVFFKPLISSCFYLIMNGAKLLPASQTTTKPDETKEMTVDFSEPVCEACSDLSRLNQNQRTRPESNSTLCNKQNMTSLYFHIYVCVCRCQCMLVLVICSIGYLSGLIQVLGVSFSNNTTEQIFVIMSCH